MANYRALGNGLRPGEFVELVLDILGTVTKNIPKVVRQRDP